MSLADDRLPESDKKRTERRKAPASSPALTLNLVSAFGGDRPLTELETILLEDLKQCYGGEFHVELLYTITHERFPSVHAEDLWRELLRHKWEISEALHRNVGLTIAALDYFSCLKGEVESPTRNGHLQLAEIARSALRDDLTRLFNQTACLEKLNMELKIHQRYGRAGSLLMLDVDDLKTINDEHGQQAGDRVLAAVGGIIDEATRGSDVCCRFGGEEFAVILPATDCQNAGLLAERLRTKAEKGVPDGLPVTISIGVASFGVDTATAQAVVDKADAALYWAKQSGKNCVVISA